VPPIEELMTSKPTILILGVTLTSGLLGMSCSMESVPAERRERAKAQLDEYTSRSRADEAESDRKRAEEFKREISDPGSLSIEESDAQIAVLRSSWPLQRARAAEELGDAKGRRAVDALVAALRTETDPLTFGAIAGALKNIHDGRATEALVDALSAPGMPDGAREQALEAIVAFHSQWRFGPQIRRFYSSLTDESVRARVGDIVGRLGG
jgi:HEAT repeat protein